MSDRIESLIHLYVDGAFNRRELVRRLTKYTGSAAAAIAALESAGLANAQSAACPTGVRVPETDPNVLSQNLTISGEASPLFIYQSLPLDWASARRPAILVVHENRGINEHTRDVTRRFAKAGYVAIAIDLLSRQGGTDRFGDPEQANAAYNRTQPQERRQDMLSALLTIRDQSYVRSDRVASIGFCAGGSNVWDVATNSDVLSAAVSFYGFPPPVASVAGLNCPILLAHGELDRGLTGNMGPIIQALSTGQKRFEAYIYPEARHAFFNDTGASYEPAASCDIWPKTLTFLNKWLNRP